MNIETIADIFAVFDGLVILTGLVLIVRTIVKCVRHGRRK